MTRWVLSVGLLTFVSCVSYPYSDDLEIEAPLPPPPDVALFDYDKDASWKETWDNENNVLTIELPSRSDLPGETMPLRAHLHAAEGPPTAPVLVLPILGGRYQLARHIAHALAEQGLSAIWVERRGPLLDDERDLQFAREQFVGAVIDSRRVMDWLEQSPWVLGDRIGVFGVSRGGLIASLISAIDPRVDASVIAIAGGDFPSILEHSTEKDVVHFRDAQVRRAGYSFDRFRREVQTNMRDVDPLTYAGRMDPKSLLMFAARFDTVIPRECTQALWRASGRPRMIEFAAGHYGIIVFLSYCEREGYLHLASILNSPPEPHEGSTSPRLAKTISQPE